MSEQQPSSDPNATNKRQRAKLDLIERLRIDSPDYDCSYLPGRKARLEYRLIDWLSNEAYESLLSRGWRRFGQEFFRPICTSCRECRALRVIVAEFKPSKSQRRCIRKNDDIRVVVQSPTVTEQHLVLFDDYHRDMQLRKGWPYQPMDEISYRYSFLGGSWSFAREFLYYLDDQLIGVGLIDQTDRALSSIYFYHAPELRHRGLGVYSLLTEWRYALDRELTHLYLGYWIKDCPSMSYKANYRPHELIEDYLEDEVEPNWIKTG